MRKSLVTAATAIALVLSLGAVSYAVAGDDSDDLALQVAATTAATVLAHNQTYIVVEAVKVNIALKSAFDMNKSITLKKGQWLVLKGSTGQMVEIDGPYSGKAIDHYSILPDGKMGYDSLSSGSSRANCSVPTGKPHPAGGPDPDETGGPELQSKHCK